MSAKLIPTNPQSVTVIRSVTSNITTASAPFKRNGTFNFGGRATLVRLTNGAIAVFSPTALIPPVQETIDKWGGNVGYLVALDFEHHIFLGEWAKAFPKARVIGPDGLAEKREKDPEFKGTVKFDHVFTGKNKTELSIDPAFDSDFDTEYVGSHMNRELVFCYKPEKTLIEADLLFNMPPTEQYSLANEAANAGFPSKIFNALMNTRGSAWWQKAVIWYGPSKADRPAFNQSMQQIDKWDFDRIIPCHGDVIETGGKDIFRKVMEWHLQQKK